MEGTQWGMYKAMMGMVMEASNMRKATKVGTYVTNESHWVTKHTRQERSGLGCRAGESLFQSLYPFPL